MRLFFLVATLYGLICSAQEVEIRRIHPRDVLHISVRQEPNLSRSLVVGADGFILMPLLNEIHVSGLTKPQVEELLAEKLRNFVAHPQVTVQFEDTPQPLPRLELDAVVIKQ